MVEKTNLSQSVDFLGFLRSQMSGLQGIPTLCYELIQNADDVKDEDGNPGATQICFDVCDDALWVENNGVFRDIDFERMRRVSWGDKRDEAETTGAFGIGFISVYQITDSPELFSSGRHWVFRPNEIEGKRITEEHQETDKTRFRLPWAFETSQVRNELGIPLIKPDQLDVFTQELANAIEGAALFLKQVRHLEVKRNGKPIRSIEVLKEGNNLLIADGNNDTSWKIIKGSFETTALPMRKHYGDLIETKRGSEVRLAIPDDVMSNGLLYAFLPSETHSGLPFHINADFYPSPDRKRILFDQDFKSDWNRLAIECAASTLADNFEDVFDLFKPDSFWEFADQVKKASERNSLKAPFDLMWKELAPRIQDNQSVLTSLNALETPTNVYYLDVDEVVEAAEIFEEFGVRTVHSDLRKYRNALMDTGVSPLTITPVSLAIEGHDLKTRHTLEQMPVVLQSTTNWEVFYKALNILWESASAEKKEAAGDLLQNSAIAFGEDEALWSPKDIFKADSVTRDLFSKISNVMWYSPTSSDGQIPGILVNSFRLEEGIAVLEGIQDQLFDFWKEGFFDPIVFCIWLKTYREILQTDQEIRNKIRSLAVWPTADGNLKPLPNLYLAGNFDDPLGLAKLIDLETLSGNRDFLEQVLDVSCLDFLTYVRDWIPAALSDKQINAQKRIQLIVILAENLGRMQDHEDIQVELSELDLIWLGKNQFCPVKGTYFQSELTRSILESTVNFARIPEHNQDSVHALYVWLGVSEKPQPKDIINRIKDITDEPPTKRSVKIIQDIFIYLGTHWNSFEFKTQEEYSTMCFEEWLPGSKDTEKWFQPDQLYASFQKHYFETQGNFLVLDHNQQTRTSDFLKFLEINQVPDVNQVVTHLLYCSKYEIPVNKEVLTFLSQKSDAPEISKLKKKACLYLSNENGDQYYKPSEVFWEEHPFGKFRFRLTPEFGKYKDLFDRLGVKDKPDEQDAIDVLLEITETREAKSNLPITKPSDLEKVLQACWKMLTDALLEQRITKSFLSKSLGKKKTIPNTHDLLNQPERLFIEDRPGWSDKFELIKNNLTMRVEGAWPAMEAAGVQRLSKAITTELHTIENPLNDDLIANRIHERKDLISRIIEAHISSVAGKFDLDKLMCISFTKAETIEIVRSLKVFNRVDPKHEQVSAVQIGETIYFCSIKGTTPWIDIARELTYVLSPDSDLPSIGMGLKEVISPDSRSEAEHALDQYGFHRTVAGSDVYAESDLIQSLGGDELPFDPGIGIEYPDKVPDKTTREVDTSPGGDTGLEKDTAEARKRKISRLVSYVYPDEVISKEKTDAKQASKLKEIGQLGVDLVMKYEKSQDREPIDMETIRVNNPGFDVKSVNNKDPNQVRYIEVKSTRGIWDSQNPAQLTKTEFELAVEYGENYWLYFVEQVESDNPRLYCIQNPAQRVNYFLFDHGWQPVATIVDDIK